MAPQVAAPTSPYTSPKLHLNMETKRRKLNSTAVSSPHPLGIRPQGNLLLLASEDLQHVTNYRRKSLGRLAALSDDILYSILGEVEDANSLRNFAQSSKYCYAFGWQDELWKHMFVRDERVIKQWKGSWKRSYWHLDADQEARISCNVHNLDTGAVSGTTTVYSDLLYRPFQCSQVNFETYLLRGLDALKGPNSEKLQIERVSKTLSEAEFQEKSNTPFILTETYPRGDGTETCSWKETFELFDTEKLVERFGHVIFRQECVDWPLKLYREYMKNNQDESPLYLFDCRSTVMRGSGDTEDKTAATTATSTETVTASASTANGSTDNCVDGVVASEVTTTTVPFRNTFIDPYVPSIFLTDLFALCGSFRPDYSWMIVGPTGSGSTFHKDPNATCAWNSVMKGTKYWLMFPPSTPPPGVHTDSSESEVTAPCSLAEWFLGGFFTETMELARTADPKRPPPFLHGLCHTGETMYVPSGWWHMVLNVQMSPDEVECVAITQNFIPRGKKLAESLKFLRDKPDQISGFCHDKIVEAAKEHGVECDPEAPEESVYELFVRQLRQSEHAKDLDEALEMVPAKKVKKAALADVWKEVVGEKEKGFSFGFGGDADETASEGGFSFGFSV